MNVLTAVRANATGLLSPTPAERRNAFEKVCSSMRANLLGRMLKAETLTKASTGVKESTASAQTGNELGRDAFLELLLAQIQFQDPLEPVGNTEMIAQLAQFSALEQMTQLNEGFESLRANIDQLSYISASSLLGRRVTGISSDGLPLEGLVERVEMEGSGVVLTVNGQRVILANVIGIQ